MQIGDIVSKDRQALLQLENDGEEQNVPHHPPAKVDHSDLANEQEEPPEEEAKQDEDAEEPTEKTQSGAATATQPTYRGINAYKTEIVDESNIAQYTIEDVLVPIIGAKLKLEESSNLKQQLNEVFDELGITWGHFQEIGKEFFVEGGYRLLIGKTEDPEFRLFS